ncbi:MAG TPA: glucose 1-dehydrogenase [Mycobacteriales bacterium]|nr:glucose 1-dehydrogenase [Mycobacteriales bacterium]
MAEQKVALVTGSTSGIGEAVARRLLAQGTRVVLNSVTSVDAGRKLVDELGGDAHYVQGDISVDADVARLVEETVAHFGRLDILVNNAGTTVRIPHHELEAATPEIFRRLYDVNVVGTWALTVAAMPHLRATGAGCVVNVSSLAGVRPAGSSIPYAASKAALNHLTRLLANVVGPEVRVNAVAPGLVDTPWTEGWDDVRAGVNAMAPLKRSAQPDDVAEVVLALVASAYVTGEVWVIDGGLALR